MTRAEILRRLKEAEAALRARGVRHAALFGSRARDTPSPDSDIDIIIDLEPDAVSDLYAYVGLKTYIGDLFPGPVDVIDRAALKPNVRPFAEANAVFVF